MRGFSLTLFLTCATSGLALPVVAQETAAAPQIGGLEEIVVTARRREENLQDTPVSITAFSGAKLEAMNVQEVSKIANFTPGLELVPSGTTQGVAVSIRGIATYDPILTNEPSVSLYVDGIYVNALSYGQFDTLDLDRVEVLRGPQGTLFGRNTTGGAINIVTRRPGTEFGVEAVMSYATHDEFVGRARVDTGELAPGWRASLSYQYRKRDGYVDDITRPDNRDPGATEANALRAALHGEIGDFALDYTFDMVLRRDIGPHNQFAIVSDAYGAFFGQSEALGGDPLRFSADRLKTVNAPDVPRAHNDSYNHALTLAYAFSDAINLKSITGYRDWQSDEIQPFGSSSGMNVPLLDFDANGNVVGATVRTVDPYIGGGSKKLKQFTQELQVLGTLPRLNYTMGAYYYHGKYAEDNPQTYVFVLSPTAGVAGAGRLAYQGKTESWALFGQASYTPAILDDNLELTVGLRYTEDRKSVDTQVYQNGLPPPFTSAQADKFENTSYNVTANYKFTPDISAYARFGTGYRAGGFSPRGFDAPAYNPEKAKVYEIGLKSELFDRRLRANFAAYRTEYDDLQITQPGFSDTAGFVSNTINAGSAVYQGFEVEFTAAPAEGLTLTADVSYVDPEYKEFLYLGQDLKDEAKFGYVSKWSTHVGGRYQFPATDWGVWSIALDYSYKSKRVFESLSSDPIGLPNARDDLAGGGRDELSGRIALSQIPLSEGASMDIALYGENLLNDIYRVSTIDFGALGFGTAIYNRPRVIGVQAKLVF
ncbi:iron complex outermembrane recepter protein [Sphingomonas laterariae]|uniref:Iron complex outermembrane recepter protein n=1 Tax=Edaphosphingomonas laterariae TaxID=861865 RepID=A0A239I240_9SPHN|nr:TonB-dependent receptor [Sphingomonas laterariae]SNS87730.1 iron complex outermembrane recepter protein [Sphingomonas laterariae]